MQRLWEGRKVLKYFFSFLNWFKETIPYLCLNNLEIRINNSHYIMVLYNMYKELFFFSKIGNISTIINRDNNPDYD
jgi:hypothetical protein